MIVSYPRAPLCLVPGDDWSEVVVIKNEDGSAANLTGWVIESAEIRLPSGATIALSTSADAFPEGKIGFEAAAAQTVRLPHGRVSSIKIRGISPSGNTKTLYYNNVNGVQIATSDILTVEHLGLQGAQGPQGGRLLLGQGEPTSDLGSNGDQYIDEILGRMWAKDSGLWASSGETIFGTIPQDTAAARDLAQDWASNAVDVTGQIPNFASLIALRADTDLGYTGSAVHQVGAGIVVHAEGERYEVAASAASDSHLTTAGGVKLYHLRQPPAGANVNAFPLTDMRDILFLGDSLTASSGMVELIENAVRGHFGFGGSGYIAFAVGGPSGTTFASSGFLSIGAGGTDPVMSSYAPNFSGLYTDAFVSGNYAQMGPGFNWDSCQLVYLKQPGGAQFIVDHQNKSPGNYRYTVNTDDAATGLGMVEITKEQGGANGVTIRHAANGKLALFGCIFRIANGLPVIHKIASGGKMAADYASKPAQFTIDFMALLNPKLACVNLGMNDRLTRSAAQYVADIGTILSRLPAGCTTKLLSAPHQSSDENTVNLRFYRPALKAYAEANRLGYTDESVLLGTYGEANSKGWMTDGVHPSALATFVRARNICSILGLPASAPLTAKTAYATIGASVLREGNLANIDEVTVAGGATQKLYTLGIAGQFTMCLFELEVWCLRSGGDSAVKSTHRFQVKNNGTTAGASAVYAPVNSEQARWDAPTALAYTVAATLVSGKAEVTVTPTTNAMIFSVRGRYHFSKAPPAGQSVFEY